MEAAGAAIEAALDGNQLQEAWNLAKGWYRQASNRSPKPSHEDFEMLYEERSRLYMVVQPTGELIPIRAKPFAVSDGVLDEEEIADACQALRLCRACGASGIRPEHLWEWLKEYH